MKIKIYVPDYPVNPPDINDVTTRSVITTATTSAIRPTRASYTPAAASTSTYSTTAVAFRSVTRTLDTSTATNSALITSDATSTATTRDDGTTLKGNDADNNIP